MLRNLGRQCFSGVRFRPQPLRSYVRFQHATAPPPACWQCGASQQHASVLCAGCQAIQPVSPNVDYYDLLLESKQHSFDVDHKALRFKFLTLQQKAHPDSYSQASKREHEYAQLQSSTLNKAYHTLKDPLARAKYLLELEGVEVGESDSLTDPALLMEVMEIREELDEATTEEQVAQVKHTNDEKFAETVQRLSSAFANKDLDAAKKFMIQLQYWESIRHAIIEWTP